MSLKDALAEVGGLRRFRAHALPATPQMESAATSIAEQMARMGEIVPFDIDRFEERLIDIGKTGNWAGVSEHELKYVPYCLWRSIPPLANNERILQGYLDALRSVSSRLVVKALIRAYFQNFDPGQQAIDDIGQFLARAVGRWDWPWRTHHQKLRLFDPEKGPGVAAELAMANGNPKKFFDDLGFKGPLATSQFISVCFARSAEWVGDRLSERTTVADAQVITSWARGKDGQLAFYGQRSRLANSLLENWGGADPSEELRAHLTSFFLETYDDPRISPRAWEGVSEDARNVMLRWLAHGSLEQFLRVVDKIAPGHHWDQRRAFWSAYIEQGFVRDAWVAFGTEGQEYAARLARDEGDASMSRFGRLKRGLSDHAVLLLSIGDLVVADWSHSGALRIWRRANANAPGFYRTEYIATDLRAECDFEKRHVAGVWQPAADNFIRQHTGARVDRRSHNSRHGRR